MNYRNNITEKGIALIIVLWVMVLLLIIVSQFAMTMRTELVITRNQKEEMESYYLAKSGINLAIFEILQDSFYHYKGSDGTLVFGDNPRIPRKKVIMEEGTISYTIVDEESKLNINRSSHKALTYFFSSLGINGESAADSIIDWIDEDDMYHNDGAEDDYYLNRPNPYGAKDSPFSAVSELLLVKSIPMPFPLKGKGKSLSDLISVHSSGINPNTASEPVLYAAYGESRAKKIIEKRTANNGIYSKSSASHTFTVISKGAMQNSSVQRKIKAIIKKINSGEYVGIRIEYWDDNYF